MNRSSRVAIVLATAAFSATSVLAAGPAGAKTAGGRIAFGSDRFGATHNLFTMNADGSDVRRLTSVKVADGADLDEQWSPDGTKLVFEDRNQDGSRREIWMMNADGSDKHVVLVDPGVGDRFPSFSPDGSHIVFARCPFTIPACALYTMTTAGAELTAITKFDVPHEVVDSEPRYSPDGKTLAFASYNRGGVVAAVYLMNAGGGRVRRLTRPRWSAIDPAWAPDGSRIAFATNCCTATPGAIWSVGTDHSNPLQLTHSTSEFDFLPNYSPDGNHIAYEVDAAGSSNIFTMNTDGSQQTEIQSNAFIPVFQPGR